MKYAGVNYSGVYADTKYTVKLYDKGLLFRKVYFETEYDAVLYMCNALRELQDISCRIERTQTLVLNDAEPF